MNIKLHTPKSLKAGSGMATMKQFLLSLIATTVSIVLTFGTAAIIDNNKKQKEKREIVMMVMYDMYNSLKSVEKGDSMLRQTMEVQRQIAEDTSKFETLRIQIATLIPTVDFTETTEQIVSSSIETINTVGNVLFTENVAKFYQVRERYKEFVCDSIQNAILKEAPAASLKGILGFEYWFYALMSGSCRIDMQHLYTQCKEMMDVSDEQIAVYKEARLRMEKEGSGAATADDSRSEKILDLQKKIEEGRKKLKLE